MTTSWRVVMLSLAAVALLGGDKKSYNMVSDDTVSVTGKAYVEPQAIKQLIGNDLGGHYIVIEVTVTPKAGKAMRISPDSFILINESDGDRSTPQSGEEIGASETLVLKRGTSMVGSYGEETGKIWTGVGLGRSSGSTKKQDDKDKDKKDTAPEVKQTETDKSLKAVLMAKQLPDKESTEAVSGLLYFPMENKKMKNLALLYALKEGKLRMYFK